MFSLFSRSKSDSYDARNPICAPIYHRLFDEAGVGSSKQAFENERIRYSVDCVHSSGLLSIKSGDLEKAEKDFCIFTIGRLKTEIETARASDMVAYFSENEFILGYDAGRRHLRDTVFGAAPAYSKDAREVYDITVRIAFCMKGMLALYADDYMHGAGHAFMLFGMHFDEAIPGNHTKDAFAARLDAWEQGYKRAA